MIEVITSDPDVEVRHGDAMGIVRSYVPLVSLIPILIPRPGRCGTVVRRRLGRRVMAE
jgi:hypothetical protein